MTEEGVAVVDLRIRWSLHNGVVICSAASFGGVYTVYSQLVQIRAQDVVEAFNNGRNAVFSKISLVKPIASTFALDVRNGGGGERFGLFDAAFNVGNTGI